MPTAIDTSPAPRAEGADQRVFMRVDWNGYLQLLALRGERSVPRITYCEGVVELMSPSVHHGYIKKTIARMLEAWALREGHHFDGYGSWTLKSEEHDRGLEPDECYIVRDIGDAEPTCPDLAIEVIWTHGGLDKLDIYRALGVQEVWLWRQRAGRGAIEVHTLRDGAYVQIDVSELLPQVDRELLARHARTKPQNAAVLAYLADLDAAAEAGS